MVIGNDIGGKKPGLALVERLTGEAKDAAISLGADKIGANDEAMQETSHLKKSYGINAVDQLDIDFAWIIVFHWKPNMSIEECIAGFNARIDKLSDSSLSDKIKVQLLLRQADVNRSNPNIIVGSALGCYEIAKISNSLRQAFRDLRYLTHNRTSPEFGHGKGQGQHLSAKSDSSNLRNYDNHDTDNENWRSECGRSTFLHLQNCLFYGIKNSGTCRKSLSSSSYRKTSSSSMKKPSEKFDVTELKRLHVALGHGSSTEITDSQKKASRV